MSNNYTLQLAEVASKPMRLTDHGRYAYWYLSTRWGGSLSEGTAPIRWDHAVNYGELTVADCEVLKKAYRRAYSKYQTILDERRTRLTRNIALVVAACLKHRRFLRAWSRKNDGAGLQHFIDMVRDHFGENWVVQCPPKQVRQEVSKFFRYREKSVLRDATRPKPEMPYWDKLPLYECSGELEATSLRAYKLHPSGHTISTNRIRGYRKPYWDVGRDGGGQHEIRFRITHRIPDVACNLVRSAGSIERNGGHIHLNCKRDEEIGKAVFHSFRYHLSWFRYLAPLTRRRSRWCGVQETGSWTQAQSVKFAAVSANTFRHTGTVEIRLWPTSRNPSEWRFRASLMKAMARWSEDNAERDHETPISNETAPQAWESFYQWASIHEPETLKAVLKAMKAKARSISSTRNVDRFGAAKCDEFVRQFDATDIRLRGYRRAVRQPVTAVCSTDQ
jgi:hypothetical protein